MHPIRPMFSSLQNHSKTILITLVATCTAIASYKINKLPPPKKLFLDWDDDEEDEEMPKAIKEVSLLGCSEPNSQWKNRLRNFEDQRIIFYYSFFFL